MNSFSGFAPIVKAQAGAVATASSFLQELIVIWFLDYPHYAIDDLIDTWPIHFSHGSGTGPGEWLKARFVTIKSWEQI